MKSKHPDLDIIHMLGELKDVPERNLQAAARGRANFLSRAHHMRQSMPREAFPHQRGWNSWFRKESFAMKLTFSMLVVLALLVGSGATMAAAQASLPNQFLYGVKALTEDIKTTLTTNSSAKVERLMQQSQTRVQEMVALQEQRVPIPARAGTRLQQHIEAALRLAAGQGDQEMQASLLRIRTLLQIQEQVISQVRARAGDEADPILEQTRLMLQERLRIVNEGLADPQQLRNMIREQHRANQSEASTPTPTPEVSATPEATPTPMGRNGPNGAGTPMPNGNNGSGPYETPGDGGTNGNDSGGGHSNENETGDGSNTNDGGNGSNNNDLGGGGGGTNGNEGGSSTPDGNRP